ncbi:MAG: hypothetical protein ACK5JS_06070 [Mangrovibacterium sp.]
MKVDFKEIEELRKISGVNSGFRTPEGYFETLEDRLEMRMEAFGEEKKPSAKVIQLFKPMLALAACFVLVMLLFRYPAQQISDSYADAESMSTTELFELAVNNYVGDMELANLLWQDDAEHTDADTELMVSELTCYVNDLDLISGMMNE